MALTVGYLLACAVVGLTRGRRSPSALLAACLAALIVCAQFAVLLTR
jgi:hypothetical protein